MQVYVFYLYLGYNELNNEKNVFLRNDDAWIL